MYGFDLGMPSTSTIIGFAIMIGVGAWMIWRLVEADSLDDL